MATPLASAFSALCRGAKLNASALALRRGIIIFGMSCLAAAALYKLSRLRINNACRAAAGWAERAGGTPLRCRRITQSSGCYSSRYYAPRPPSVLSALLAPLCLFYARRWLLLPFFCTATPAAYYALYLHFAAVAVPGLRVRFYRPRRACKPACTCLFTAAPLYFLRRCVAVGRRPSPACARAMRLAAILRALFCGTAQKAKKNVAFLPASPTRQRQPYLLLPACLTMLLLPFAFPATCLYAASPARLPFSACPAPPTKLTRCWGKRRAGVACLYLMAGGSGSHQEGCVRLSALVVQRNVGVDGVGVQTSG